MGRLISPGTVSRQKLIEICRVAYTDPSLAAQRLLIIFATAEGDAIDVLKRHASIIGRRRAIRRSRRPIWVVDDPKIQTRIVKAALNCLTALAPQSPLLQHWNFEEEEDF